MGWFFLLFHSSFPAPKLTKRQELDEGFGGSPDEACDEFQPSCYVGGLEVVVVSTYNRG